MTETSESFKEQGNEAFTKKDFKLALQLYSQSLELQPFNHLVWSNRSAARAEMKDYDGAIQDAKKAVDLCPKWPKGFVRKAIALAHKGDIFLAIESYEEALKIGPNATVAARVKDLEKKFYQPRYKNRPTRSADTESLVNTRHLDVALALAAGRGIEFSGSPSVATVRDAITEHVRRDPEWDAPKRRFLFIPCAGDRLTESGPTTPCKFEFDPMQGDVVLQTKKLLGCEFTDSEFLYSEDGAEILRRNRNGVGLGYIYRTYEFIMDDNCIFSRPLNELASKLLHRPETYGPVLVMRTTHFKGTQNLYQLTNVNPLVIGWEVMSLEELESEEWRIKRTEWKRLLQKNRDTEAKKIFGRSLASSELEEMFQDIPGMQFVDL